MPEFRYTVMDAAGQTVRGVLNAESLEACREIIANRGLFCLNITEANLANRPLQFGSGRVRTKELAVFFRQFAAMSDAGIGVVKALDILSEKAQNKRMKAALQNVSDGVRRGQSLSAALKAQSVFPEFPVHMIEAGESGGKLDETMNRLAEYYEKNAKIQNRVRNAMVYPVILSAATVAVVIFLLVAVLPVFAEMFDSSGARLPGVTRLLLAVGESVSRRWYLHLSVLGLIVLAFRLLLRSDKGRLYKDRKIVRLPLAGPLILTVLSSRFSRTLSSLTESGVPVLRALEITAKVLGNRHFEERLTGIRDEIRRGASLSESLEKSEMFPALLTSMIRVGEESGKLDQILRKTSDFYDEEADAAVGRLLSLFEPMMIVVLGVIIGLVVIAIVLPMYGMMRLIR